MSSKLFADTSGWACLFDATQPNHLKATQLFTQTRQQQTTFVTTNYVIAELVALFHSPLRLPRPQIFQIVDSLKTAPYLEIIYIDMATDTDAWNLCKSRLDKAWSLVDCTSFVIMQQLNIHASLTTDRHFEQAGFTRLLMGN